jgi:hypothetical protein
MDTAFSLFWFEGFYGSRVDHQRNGQTIHHALLQQQSRPMPQSGWLTARSLPLITSRLTQSESLESRPFHVSRATCVSMPDPSFPPEKRISRKKNDVAW